MFCGNCGEKLDESAKFCPKCGKQVNGIPVQPKMQEQLQEVVETIDTSNQNVSEDQESIIYQTNLFFSDQKLIGTAIGIGPFILTNKRIIMVPEIGDYNHAETRLNEMEVSWNNIVNVEYSMRGIFIYFHYVTKAGKDRDKIMVCPITDYVKDGMPVFDSGKENELFAIIYSAWKHGR